MCGKHEMQKINFYWDLIEYNTVTTCNILKEDNEQMCLLFFFAVVLDCL